MTKLALPSTALALVLAFPAAAAAQTAPSQATTSSCPPGSWFCTEPPPQQAAPTPAGQSMQGLQPLPDADESTEAPATHHDSGVTYQPAPQPSQAPPPVVVYQPPPPVMVVRPEAPPPYEYRPPRRESVTPPREWGLNLRIEGAMIGHGYNGDAGMGGGGFGLRFKPNRYFGLEGDLDFVGGHDYQGDQRNETAFTLNALMFLNPRSRAQIYMLAGFGWSGAHVTSDPAVTSTPLDAQYSYFGGQFGMGLELRLTRVLACNVDLRGFIRGRTDGLAQTQPEFARTDAFGYTQTTNTSGGGLLTAGMTLYF
jgi:hypothetical protein